MNDIIRVRDGLWMVQTVHGRAYFEDTKEANAYLSLIRQLAYYGEMFEAKRKQDLLEKAGLGDVDALTTP